jgi:hypothetical protein
MRKGRAALVLEDDVFDAVNYQIALPKEVT